MGEVVTLTKASKKYNRLVDYFSSLLGNQGNFKFSGAALVLFTGSRIFIINSIYHNIIDKPRLYVRRWSVLHRPPFYCHLTFYVAN